MATVKCNFCGATIPAECTTCPKCGAPHDPVITQNLITNEVEDEQNGWLNLLAFVIPLYGLIAYFVIRNETPNKAKGLLTWGIIGFVVACVFEILVSL